MKKITIGDFIHTADSESLISKALKDGRLSYGPITRKFEAAFAYAHDCLHAIFVKRQSTATEFFLDR